MGGALLTDTLANRFTLGNLMDAIQIKKVVTAALLVESPHR